MGIVFIRIVWGIWFAFSLFLIASALSKTAFDEKKSIKSFGQGIAFALVWPIALLSKRGRKYIKKQMEKII